MFQLSAVFGTHLGKFYSIADLEVARNDHASCAHLCARPSRARFSNRFEGRFARLTNRRKLALKVLQKKGTGHLRRNHIQFRAESGEQVKSMKPRGLSCWR